MRCPHCLVDYHADFKIRYLEEDPDGHWWFSWDTCSACKRLIYRLIQSASFVHTGGGPYHPDARPTQVKSDTLIRPKGIARTPVPAEVPEHYMNDYREACLVLPDSPAASAALSRRALQHILREEAKVESGNLANEIEQVINGGTLPTDLAGSLDAIRNIGNFAAHPQKSTHTGEVLPVEPGEAEWNLEVLEELFDFYFVRPVRLAAKRDALNKKLLEAGKPPMKGIPSTPSTKI